jgi:hypothetical protein
VGTGYFGVRERIESAAGHRSAVSEGSEFDLQAELPIAS